ncbi:MAG: hypothetical protein MUP19_03260 [Candidatus Aminicenantes bacterium]|nr:hypothetical protein [Candidatus Aminicenantes bacterium]
MAKFKYTKEDVLKEMEQALNETGGVNKPAKPNAIQGLLAKAKLGKK